MTEVTFELQRQTAIDSRIESYQGFFDPRWARSFLEASQDSKLREPAFALVCDWDCASNARSLPWVLATCLQRFLDCEFEQYEPLDLRKIRILRDKLVSKLEQKGETVRPMLRKKLIEAIEEVDVEATDICNWTRKSVQSTQDDLWDVLVAEQAFLTAVWASERACYGTVYYAYECFIRECIRTASGEPEYRVERAEQVKDRLKSDFGAELTQACWSDQQINIARLTRNALVHNGGFLTDQLRKQPHGFRVDGELIQIGAPETTNLFELLKQRALQIAQYAATLPEFSRDHAA